MSIALTCPACGAYFRLAEDLCGRKLYCPLCGKGIVLTSAGLVRREGRYFSAPANTRRHRFPWGLLAAVPLVGAIGVAFYLLYWPVPPSEQQTSARNDSGAEREEDGDRHSPRPPDEPKESRPPEVVREPPVRPVPTPDTRPDSPPRPPPAAETPPAKLRFHCLLDSLGKPGHLAAVKGIHLDAQGRLRSSCPANLEAQLSWTYCLPGKYRLDVRLPAPAAPDLRVGFDGEETWWQLGRERGSLHGDAPLDPSADYLGYFTLTGKDLRGAVRRQCMVRGQHAICVRPARPFGWKEDVKLYFDRDSGLLIKEEFRPTFSLGPQGKQPLEARHRVEAYYSDFRETDGLSWPRRMEIHEHDGSAWDWEFTSLRLLRKVDESLFRRP